jgi:hypothetical protein
MGLTLLFADSFAHYNQAGLPLKWAQSGTLDNTVARTGPQSLKFQSTTAPSLPCEIGAGAGTFGFAWRTGSLAGETVLSMVNTFAPVTTELYLVQNANGSISLFLGSGALLATSAPGVLTLNTWWYIEVGTMLNPQFGTPQCIVTVTGPSGVATQVINVSGFSTPDVAFQSVQFSGPGGANFAWIADLYVAQWDQQGINPFATFGAPKIYGLCPPTADSSGYVGYNTVGKTIPFPGNPAPFWSQVNTIPQNTNIGMYETDNNPGGIGWIVCGQGFNFDLSAVVPPNSSIVAAQLVALVAAAADDPSLPGKGPNYSILGGMASFNGPNPFNLPIGGSFSAQYYFSGYTYDPPYTSSLFTDYGIEIEEPG